MKYRSGAFSKIDGLRQQREDINVTYTSVSDRYNLVMEAESVLENKATEVSLIHRDAFYVLYGTDFHL